MTEQHFVIALVQGTAEDLNRDFVKCPGMTVIEVTEDSIRCGKCKEEEEWAAFREAVSNAMIKCLEAQGCRMVTLEEQMKILCDPARHIRREQSKVTILVENSNTEEP